jgi:serine/threonine protein kinase
MPETTQFGGIEDTHNEGSLKANTILVNRYKIMGVLGGGGQGAVYQARDLRFPEAKRLVAIKEMLYPSNDPNQRATTLRTFEREANILATLAHPAIPKIFDFFDQNNRAYLVEEYINGSDLELLMNKTKELPVEKITEWAIDLCDVLHYLHNHQPDPIIFRDIKPSNIMIDSFGKVRLIDFGIAKKFVSGTKQTMIGTEGYSAPEQYKGDATPLSDIYSLGATLHHILTRKDPRLEAPFTFNERPILDFAPKAPQGMVDVIEKALAMEPKDRFQSMAEMKEALERVKMGAAPAAGKTAARTNGNPNATSLFEGEEFSASAIEPRWKFKTEDEIRGGPACFRDMAFVGSYDTNVWAVKMDSGEFAWKFPTTGGIAASPVIDNSNRLVLFGSEDNTFNAVDYQNGRINWTYSTKGRIRSTARVAHDHVFFGSDDGFVYALVAGNGRYLWQYDMGAPVRTRPFVTNDLIIVGAESGELVGLELAGSRKWTYRVKRSINSSPVVDDQGICYFGGFDGNLYALDSANGYNLWRFRTNGPIVASVVKDGEFLYFGSTDGVFYCVNAESAREKWRFTVGKPVVATAAVHKGSVYFGGTDGAFYCVDLKTGKEKWKFETGGGITSAPYLSENIILVSSMDKTLYALPMVN